MENLADQGLHMIRILHVITDLKVGGAQTMLHKLIEHRDRGRFEHVVISLMDLGVIGEKLRNQGVEVIALGRASSYPGWGAICGLARQARRIRPDMVQGWMYHGNLAAWLAWRFCADEPALIWGIRQSLGQLSDEKWLTRQVIRANTRLSGDADAVIYNAQRSRLQHIALGMSDKSSIVIPNGFDAQRFSPSPSARIDVRRELGLAEDAVLVGLIGRFHPMKDHHGFLKAATEVIRHYGSVYFFMAGDDVSGSNEELCRWIAEQGLTDRIYLLGRRDDIPRLMAALDVAVSASARNEGFANVIGEAMACGVPCVVTDVGDSAMIVSATGRVVPPGNPLKLAEAICDLLNLGRDEREGLGRSAREHLVSEFSIENTISRFEALYMKFAK